MEADPCHSQVPCVLHRERDWVAVHKPAGWHSVVQSRSDGSPTVEEWLRQGEPALAALEDSGLVHRLDKGTSGCLIAATTVPARESLRDAFTAGEFGARLITKRYLARLSAAVEDRGEFSAHFSGRHKRSAKVTVSRAGAPNTQGTIRWSILDRGSNLFDVELVGPGRRHQIRAGFASLGAPLVGDTLYGGPAHPSGFHLLHAWQVQLDGVVVESPRPTWAHARA